MRGDTSRGAIARTPAATLLVAALLALFAAGCGGSGGGAGTPSKQPSSGSTQTGPSGKLSQAEYQQLQQVRMALRSTKGLPSARQMSKLRADCGRLGDTTQLLTSYRHVCLNMVALMSALVDVDRCFKQIAPTASTDPTKIFSCEAASAPVATAARSLRAEVAPLDALLQRRNLPKKCFEFLALKPATATALHSLESKTSGMVAAGKQQNLVAAVAAAKAWAATGNKLGNDFNGGGNSLKVCPHA